MRAFFEGFDILRSRALVTVFAEAKLRAREARFMRVDRFTLKFARELNRAGLNETAENFSHRIMYLLA